MGQSVWYRDKTHKEFRATLESFISSRWQLEAVCELFARSRRDLWLIAQKLFATYWDARPPLSNHLRSDSLRSSAEIMVDRRTVRQVRASR